MKKRFIIAVPADDYISDAVDTAGQPEADWPAWAERWKIADDPYHYFRW